MIFGYGRVSTRDQHPENQAEMLLASGVEDKNIYVEKASTRLAVRPELEHVRTLMRAGDTLRVTKADRLARSLLDLITLADQMREQGITLEFLSGAFNRDDPMGEAFFQMTGVFAQLERDLISQRTREALAVRTARGRKGGRKQKLTEEQQQRVRELYELTDEDKMRKYSGTDLAAMFGVSRSVIYETLNPARRENARKARRDRYQRGKQAQEPGAVISTG